MIAWLISRLIALAILLFVASLPVARTAAGALLRRWAGFCFIAAIAPSVFFGIAQDVAPTTGGSANPVLGAIAGVFLLLLLSAGAYVALMLRRRLRNPGPRRLEMKQPFNAQRRQDDFLTMLRDQLERDDG